MYHKVNTFFLILSCLKDIGQYEGQEDGQSGRLVDHLAIVFIASCRKVLVAEIGFTETHFAQLKNTKNKYINSLHNYLKSEKLANA
jgi:hypothetical protein